VPYSNTKLSMKRTGNQGHKIFRQVTVIRE
jgi:hypothetical protein